MNVDSVSFEPITGPLPTDWVIRVVIRGTEFEQRAIPMAAEIGTQPVEGIMPGFEEGTVVGFLAAAPSPGDELRIGCADELLTDTGITFQTLVSGEPS